MHVRFWCGLNIAVSPIIYRHGFLLNDLKKIKYILYIYSSGYISAGKLNLAYCWDLVLFPTIFFVGLLPLKESQGLSKQPLTTWASDSTYWAPHISVVALFTRVSIFANKDVIWIVETGRADQLSHTMRLHPMWPAWVRVHLSCMCPVTRETWNNQSNQ